ncbi:hypothetical protein [Anaeromyxobacter oryzae]|uniref:Lipoprotein n=1 Tax=Anaeromyxobacter oryzae TaxID=2918170 RepID=A0ABM7WQJ1_9BACT|nr:hypothetical protein [Anaeromyxobacter oryzae]BDG01738.1 hypothetical protein AMOR_07340 [Anaeromyxobacter oryzae]
MTPPRLAVLAITAALALACRTAEPRALVRVDAPPAEPGAPADAQALRVERAVRSVADEERLVCLEGGGAVLLTCSPADVGSRSVQVRLTVQRAGSGIEVIGDAPFAHPGDPDVCRLASRLVRAVDAELGVPSARVHPGSGCPMPAEAR